MGRYYVVRRGWRPGIYETWAECDRQVNGFRGSVYKGFDTQQEAEIWFHHGEEKGSFFYAVVNGDRSGVFVSWAKAADAKGDSRNARVSKFTTEEEAKQHLIARGVRSNAIRVVQSQFDKYTNFTPNPRANFSDEFDRLARAQNWHRGSETFKREKALAAETELERHFFIKQEDGVELTPEESLLRGYQALSREVGKPVHQDIFSCLQELKRAPFINIVNLIDSRRNGTRVLTFHDFAAFREYTRKPGRTINQQMAQQGRGILASLLQILDRGPVNVNSESFRRNARVQAGRIGKPSQTRQQQEQQRESLRRRLEEHATQYIKEEPKSQSEVSAPAGSETEETGSEGSVHSDGCACGSCEVHSENCSTCVSDYEGFEEVEEWSKMHNF